MSRIGHILACLLVATGASAEPRPEPGLTAEGIMRMQASVAERVFRQRAMSPRIAAALAERDLGDRLSRPPDDPSREARYIMMAVDQGFPVEAFDENALLLAYVEQKRREYQGRLAQGRETSGAISDGFRRHLFVEDRFILDDLPPDVVAKGHQWRLHYLRRLKHEEADPAHTTACAAAWGVDMKEVERAPWSADFLNTVCERWDLSDKPNPQEIVASWAEGRLQMPQTIPEKRQYIIKQIRRYCGNSAALQNVRERAEHWGLSFDRLMEESQQPDGAVTQESAPSAAP